MPKQLPPRTALLIKQVQMLQKRDGLTQKELADILGYSPRTIQSRLQGQYPFTIEEVWTLEDHFGVTFQKDAKSVSLV